MPLQISPFQVRRSPLDPTPQPQKPVWGPPDMAEQLQKGIAGIGQAFKQQYDTSYTRGLQQKAGQEWLDASKLAGPGGPYAPGGQLPAGVSSPQELPQAGALKPQIAGMIGEAAKKYGLDPTYLSKLVQIESAGDPTARNAGSGAAGLFQFVPGTWKQYGQGDPLDPAANIDAGARFTLANQASLRAALGRDPTAGELYLAHQQGIGGATKLLTGDQNRPVADVLGKNATSNLGGLSKDATVGQFVTRWTQPFGGVGAAPAPTIVKGPGGVSYAVAPGAGAAASSGQQAAGDQPTAVAAKPRRPVIAPPSGSRADASGRIQVASADPGFVPNAPAQQAQAAVAAGNAYKPTPPPRPIGTGGSGDVFQSQDIQVRPVFQPGQKFGETATKNAQPFSGIVLHHTATDTLDQALKISRGDPNRGGVPYGYHFYIDRDGSVIQGAPLSARTNHTHSGAGYDNANSIGISLVGNSKDATPQQIEAGTKLAQQLSGQLGIAPDRIAGHGQIRGEKEADEGLPILAALRGGVPPASSSPTSRNAPGAPGAAIGPGGGPGGAPTMQQLQAALAQAPAGFQQAFNALASKAPGGAQGLLGMLGGMIGKMTGGGGGGGGAPPPGGGSAPGPQGAPGGVPASAPNQPGQPVPSQVNAGTPLFQPAPIGQNGAPQAPPPPQQPQGPGAQLAAAAAAPGPLVMPQGAAAPPPEPVQAAQAQQQGPAEQQFEQIVQQLSQETGETPDVVREKLMRFQGGPGGRGGQQVAAAQQAGVPGAGMSYPGTMSDADPGPAPQGQTADLRIEPRPQGEGAVVKSEPIQPVIDANAEAPVSVRTQSAPGQRNAPKPAATATVPAPVVAPAPPAVAAPAPPAAAAAPAQIPQAAAAAATKIGLNPDALSQMSPAMMRSLGYAIQAGEPAMVGAIVQGINAMTARDQTKGDDWSVQHDGRGNWFRVNKKTGETAKLDVPGAGAAATSQDTILQPGDPRRDKYTNPNDPRPWRLTTDDKGNIKPEPLVQNPIQEEAGKIATGLESTETYKKFKSQYGSMNAMEAALAEGTAAGDFNATLEAFKVVDPGSTVTTNEQGGIKILGGAEGVLKGWKSRVDANGGFLTEDMRAELFNAALEQTRATWHAGAKNDVEAARRKGLLLGRGDKDVVGIATNFHEPPSFTRREPGDFPDGGRPIDGKPRNPNSRAGGDSQPGRSQSKPYVVKRTFKTRDEAHAYLDAVGDRNPGWYQVTIEGEGTLPPVHAGQEP